MSGAAGEAEAGAAAAEPEREGAAARGARRVGSRWTRCVTIARTSGAAGGAPRAAGGQAAEARAGVAPLPSLEVAIGRSRPQIGKGETKPSPPLRGAGRLSVADA